MLYSSGSFINSDSNFIVDKYYSSYSYVPDYNYGSGYANYSYG